MPTLKKSKPEADVDSLAPSVEFEAAKSHWNEISAKHVELVDRTDGMRLAISFALHGIDKHTPAHLREKAKPYMRTADRRPVKFAEEIEDAETELADFKPKLGVENEAWQAALRRETDRLGATLQPRHREAVVSIGAALEALSQAILAERQVRADLARLAPLPTSANLPDLSSTLQVGCLGDWDSPAWNWRRRCHQIGVFK